MQIVTIYVCAYTCMHAYIYVYTYIYMYVCMHACICAYIHTFYIACPHMHDLYIHMHKMHTCINECMHYIFIRRLLSLGGMLTFDKSTAVPKISKMVIEFKTFLYLCLVRVPSSSL